MHLCLLCLHFYLLLSLSISSHCSMPTSVNEANLFNTCRSASDSTDLTELKRNRFPRIKHPFCRSMTQPARSTTIVLRTQSRRALDFLHSQRQPSLNAARWEPTSLSTNNSAVILLPNSFVHQWWSESDMNRRPNSSAKYEYLLSTFSSCSIEERAKKRGK